jgi:predicted nucleotidyltransferase
MTRRRNQASRWRIELARELVRFYIPNEGIRMIVLGGSPSRGLSDAYSDLDIVVYWDRIDVPWLEAIPLKDLDGRRELFKEMGEGVYLESYYFGTLKVDFGHASLDSWKRWTDEVLVKHDTDPELHGMIGGFLESVPLQGEECFHEWRERLSAYPDELARKAVEKNAIFYNRGVLDLRGRALTSDGNPGGADRRRL